MYLYKRMKGHIPKKGGETERYAGYPVGNVGMRRELITDEASCKITIEPKDRVL